MSQVERIEQEVQGLSAEELADFRKWFAGYDAALWDQQFERDVTTGTKERRREKGS